MYGAYVLLYVLRMYLFNTDTDQPDSKKGKIMDRIDGEHVHICIYTGLYHSFEDAYVKLPA